MKRAVDDLFIRHTEQAREISDLIRLFRFLGRTQDYEAANKTMIDLAVHYRDLNARPWYWAHLRRSRTHRTNGVDATDDAT